jgi:hypothetical protein
MSPSVSPASFFMPGIGHAPDPKPLLDIQPAPVESTNLVARI